MYIHETNMRHDETRPLVSIVTPVYNAETFISKTINSILSQTYQNFELILVDDLSTDNSKAIISQYTTKDPRINYYELCEKGGASVARNFAIRQSKGKYIAFLDADDTWYPKKLELQIEFMEKNNYSFTYTDFDWISESDEVSLTLKTGPNTLSYKQILKGNPIGCLTVIYDKTMIQDVQIPRIDKRNDYALWLHILKKTEVGYRLPLNLASYRTVKNSLSRNTSKFRLLKYHFYLFNNIEKKSFILSLYYTILNVVNYNKFSKYIITK